MSDEDDKYRVEVFTAENRWEKYDLEKVVKAKVVHQALIFQEQGRDMEQRCMNFRKQNAELRVQREEQQSITTRADARCKKAEAANTRLVQIIGRIVAIDALGET